MNLFPFSLDNDKLRNALQIAGRLGDDARNFFSPVPAVRNYLTNAAEAKLVRAITVRGPAGYGPLQEDLQAYGTLYNGTKATYANAIALAIWELSRRATQIRCAKAIIPTFGEIAAVAASCGFQPSRAGTSWSTEEIVRQFAKGLRSHCGTICERRLAVLHREGELSPSEQVGIADLLVHAE